MYTIYFKSGNTETVKNKKWFLSGGSPHHLLFKDKSTTKIYNFEHMDYMISPLSDFNLRSYSYSKKYWIKIHLYNNKILTFRNVYFSLFKNLLIIEVEKNRNKLFKNSQIIIPYGNIIKHVTDKNWGL